MTSRKNSVPYVPKPKQPIQMCKVCGDVPAMTGRGNIYALLGVCADCGTEMQRAEAETVGLTGEQFDACIDAGAFDD